MYLQAVERCSLELKGNSCNKQFLDFACNGLEAETLQPVLFLNEDKVLVGRVGAGRRELLTLRPQRTLSPDAGRGADAERERG